ncbi:MAG: pyruvate carboxyltransferase [Chloroflexi bacterium]|nr:pyruvate carboxyltransferase [Chloroflexota bacterium]
MQTPWRTDHWFVSPWNYLDEVTRSFQFPPSIQIHDLTLRDGEQTSGVCFRKADKVRIAAKLAELGVHRIEAGTPAVSPDDEAAVREICKLRLGPKVFALARCLVEDVRRAVDCGVDGLIVEIPCSEHLIETAYRWPLQRAIDMSIAATRAAKEDGVYVVFFPIDSTRTDINWYLSLIEHVADEGAMDALALVDTTGSLSPHAVPLMVRAAKERIKKPLECHFHADFGFGAINTINALAAGVEVAHLTFAGLGERAGNAPLEETVVALRTLYGVDLGIRYDLLKETHQLVRELSGIEVPRNKAVVGDELYDVESGIVSDWYRNCGPENVLEVFPYHWDLVGQRPPRVVLGKKSGAASVRVWLEEIGLSATDEEVRAILARVKERAIAKKGLLDRDEFRLIAEATLGT